MARRLFIFDPPDRFVPGTIGEPGARAFYLQARKGKAVVSLALEKVQVAALANRVADLLDALDGGATGSASRAARDDAPLDQPLVELFRVGAMAIAWDADARRIVIEAQPQAEDGEYVEVADEEAEGPDLLRVHLVADDAREFVRRAASLMESGRPLCPFCGEPLEPTGHFCARSNGQLN
jgi:uncharacterized repeat protein (TIGR03847 family)